MLKPRRPPADTADTLARDALLNAALPRLLRLVADHDAEAAALLSKVRQTAAANDRTGVSEADVVAAAMRIVGAVAAAEDGRRRAALANDGTP